LGIVPQRVGSFRQSERRVPAAFVEMPVSQREDLPALLLQRKQQRQVGPATPALRALVDLGATNRTAHR
jgi:hypothetical protein